MAQNVITTENLHQFTEQEVFDYVAEMLFEQNKASVVLKDDQLLCSYRGADGTKCAAGWLISDEKYEPSWDEDGETWDMLVQKGIFSNIHIGLISELQSAHDIASPDFCNNIEHDDNAFAKILDWSLSLTAERMNLKYNRKYDSEYSDA